MQSIRYNIVQVHRVLMSHLVELRQTVLVRPANERKARIRPDRELGVVLQALRLHSMHQIRPKRRPMRWYHQGDVEYHKPAGKNPNDEGVPK